MHAEKTKKNKQKQRNSTCIAFLHFKVKLRCSTRSNYYYFPGIVRRPYHLFEQNSSERGGDDAAIVVNFLNEAAIHLKRKK